MACEESMRTNNVVDDDDHDVELGVGSLMSCLSIDNDDEAASDIVSEEEEPSEAVFSSSLPGMPINEHASDDDGQYRKKKKKRERWVEKQWEKRRHGKGGTECRLLVRPMCHDSHSIPMDMMEVKACRDLGLDLPSDWTVEVPGYVSGVDSCSSGSDSPIANWRISSPGDDPKEVKTRLKIWAQAVALASASQLGSSPRPR